MTGCGTSTTVKESVRSFWNKEPCGAKLAESAEGSPEFFAEVARTRDALEPFIADFADFPSSRGKEVLEIGVGLGSEFVRFARAGAHVTGVDLTERSIELVRQRLDMEGLDGALHVADAENLPFADESFDVVYSWGVLHHTPESEAAIREAQRVLRPRGRLCVMLYARHSWVGLALWARYGLLVGRPDRSFADVISGHMESPGTRAFTEKELRTRFSSLENPTFERVSTPYDRRVAGPFARLTAPRFGWFIVTRGRKRETMPQSSRT